MTHMAESAPVAKMPGHWLLARAGKRVLRPGGRALTLRLLTGLRMSDKDSVVEFAPGKGATAARILVRLRQTTRQWSATTLHLGICDPALLQQEPVLYMLQPNPARRLY